MNARRNILIIEDHKAVRVLLTSILKKKYNVSATNNGVEAFNYLNQGNIPDLIILDFEMPKMNGIEIIKNLKISGFYNEIPLIVLSGTNQEDLKNTCIKYGVEAFLSKPFNPIDLRQKVAEIFELQLA